MLAAVSITLATRSVERYRSGQRHLDASRRLLAQSRRLLNRAWWIAGASDDNDDLRLQIRDRLIKGVLFPSPTEVWAGPGTGRFCVVCGTTISSRDIECEMILGPATIWAHHVPCHTLWREESARLNASSHAEAGASDRESASA
jgi:hypothetical protein